jgi:hypothetical protein
MDPLKLQRLTEVADNQHRAGMPDVHRSFEQAHLATDNADLTTSRRSFLRRVGTTTVAVGAVAVPLGGMASAAWAQESAQMDTMGTTAAPSCPSDPVDMSTGDEQLVVFAESVERAAVAAYELALDRKLLTPAAAESSRIFAGHHGDHAEALRCLLGGQLQEPNAELVAALAPQIEGAGNEQQIVELLLAIENGAAATYYAVLGQLTTAVVAGAASTILPVEAQHEVVWSQYLGLPLAEYVPTLQTADGAFAPA